MQNETQNISNFRKPLLPISDVFKQSFEIYFKKIWLLIKLIFFSFLSFAVFIPFGIAGFLISYGPLKNNNVTINLILADALLLLLPLSAAIIIGIWSQAAMLFAVKDDISAKEALAISWDKMGSFFWVGFLTWVIVFVGFIAFIIPGIIFSVWFIFAVFEFVCEDVKGLQALKNSKNLVKGNWWSIFVRFAIIMLISILISGAKGLGPIINTFFVAPFSLVYIYVIYRDLKK